MLCAPSARNWQHRKFKPQQFCQTKKNKKSGGSKVVRNRSSSGSLGMFKEIECLKSDKVAYSALLLKRPSSCSRVDLLVRVSIILQRTCEEFWAKTAVIHFQYCICCQLFAGFEKRLLSPNVPSPEFFLWTQGLSPNKRDPMYFLAGSCMLSRSLVPKLIII